MDEIILSWRWSGEALLCRASAGSAFGEAASPGQGRGAAQSVALKAALRDDALLALSRAIAGEIEPPDGADLLALPPAEGARIEQRLNLNTRTSSAREIW